ncbi:MAG TPA: stage II sporulation protein M [Candidatus Acidoferrales bacterium]|nr:stage II sporulation protein M [Candidatus Acidoferrales bacterium]
MKLNLSFWRSASPKKERLYSILLVFIVAFSAMVIGSFAMVGHNQAKNISNNLNQTLSEHLTDNDLAEYIFLNNFQILLLMFIPLVGAGLGLIILYETGVVLSALATVHGYPAYIAVLTLLTTPVFWLEFAAYSIAMAESIWIFRCLLRRRWGELKWFALSIGLCTLLLIIGAYVEVYLIHLAG